MGDRRDDYVPGCMTLREVALTLGLSEIEVRSAVATRELRTVKQTYTVEMVLPRQLDRFAEARGLAGRKERQP